MKKKFLSLMFILSVLGIRTFEIQAQNMYVRLKNGTEYTKQIASLQKLTFSNNQMVLKYISGATDTYSISDVSKLFFVQSSNGIEEQSFNENTNILSIYPNPVNSTIYLKNAPEEKSVVYIYRMDGAIIMEKQISSESNTIDVSNLPNGIYLIRISNKTLKFNKL